MTINSMRSHRNEAGQILLVLPGDVIGPFRNALQKLAGGVDFFALDAAERNSLDEALRHLWNPGDDQQHSRERTVPIEVLALAMRDRRSAHLAEAALPRMAAASRAQISMEDIDDLDRREILQVQEALARLDAPAPSAGASRAAGPDYEPPPPSLEDARPTVELSPQDLPASPLPAASGDRTSATRSDGYRAPTKGRHTDVSR